MKLFKAGLLALILFSCKGELKKEIITYTDGKPKFERIYHIGVNSRTLVHEIKYYPDGKKEMEGSYKNDQRHGDWTYWYDNGNVWSQAFFRKGIRDGISKVYYKDGKIKIEGMYRNGKMIDEWRYYDHEGQVIKKIKYNKKGEMVGQEDLNRPVPFK